MAAICFRTEGAPQGAGEGTEAVAFNFRNENEGAELGEKKPLLSGPRG
jgi:hypothetical protein